MMSRCYLVLVDAHRALGQPLCRAEDLSQAILDEVLQDASAKTQKSTFSQFFKQPALPNREEIRARAAAMTKAVLDGERPPPQQLPRIIDGITRTLVESQQAGIEMSCIVFGDAGDARCSPDAIPYSVAPDQLLSSWIECDSGRAVPSLAAACGGAQGLRNFQTVFVFTSRGLSLGPLVDTTLGKPPQLFWFHCVLRPPEVFKGIRDLCVMNGGDAFVIPNLSELRATFQRVNRAAPAVMLDASKTPTSVSSVISDVSKSAVSMVAKLASSDSHQGSQTTSSKVMDAVLTRAGETLGKLDPEQRKARIRELVDEEIQKKKAASTFELISRVLDASREVEQRLLLEWFIVLCRSLAFTGSIVCLCRASCVSRLWSSSLKAEGSAIARKVWKWLVRFGEEVPPKCRWAFWACLRKKHEPLIVTTGCASDFLEKVNYGRHEESLADARAVIAADVPRTFSGLSSPSNGRRRSTSLLPDGDNDDRSLSERSDALERILLAVAADCPSLGYCQGLHILAAFALSVAEESGLTGSTLEAETFAFIAGLLEAQGLRSWMEAPLFSLRAHAEALGAMLHERMPQLAAHVTSEGAEPKLLTLPWLQTFFAGFAPMPRATVCRIWECWFLDGSFKVFFRTTLALLKHCETALLSQSLEQGSEALRTFPPPLDQILEASRLLPAAWKMKVTRSKLRQSLVSAEAKVREEDKKGSKTELEAEMIDVQALDVVKLSSPSENLIELE